MLIIILFLYTTHESDHLLFVLFWFTLFCILFSNTIYITVICMISSFLSLSIKYNKYMPQLLFYLIIYSLVCAFILKWHCNKIRNTNLLILKKLIFFVGTSYQEVETLDYIESQLIVCWEVFLLFSIQMNKTNVPPKLMMTSSSTFLPTQVVPLFLELLYHIVQNLLLLFGNFRAILFKFTFVSNFIFDA